MERCRFCNCMKWREFCENIFDNKQTNPTIPAIVELFTDLKIVENDPYTKFVCFNCFKILIIFYHYRVKILETNELLLKNEINTNQNNVEDFHKKWPRIKQCDDGQFIVDNNDSDNTNLQIGNEFDEKEDQTIDKHSNILIDNDKEITIDVDNKKNCNNDDDDKDNQQLLKNSSCTEEPLGFIIKNEIDIEETCLKIENNFNDEDQEIYENNHQSSMPIDDNDQKDSPNYCFDITEDETNNKEFPSIIGHKNNQFSNNSLDNDQNERQTVEKHFQCIICGKRLSTKNGLKMHLLVHTGEKSYQCNICNKWFTDKVYLNRHLKRHSIFQTNEKAHQCNICEKKFSYKHGLTRHLKIHTGEKPHQCDICNKRFTQKDTLNLHLTTHTGEKPYQCSICNARFSNKVYLTKHLKIHKDYKPCPCTDCIN